MISLKKGEAISLKKTVGATLAAVAMGTGWDGVTKKGFFSSKQVEIDLDASALVYSHGRLVDQVWFRQLRSRDGNINHSGDNRTGDGDGDDETIKVALSRLSADIDAVVFTVNSFSGQSFAEVANAYTRLVDENTGNEIARFSLSEQGSHTGLIMAVLKRNGDDWELRAIGERANGRTFHDMQSQIEQYV